MNWIIFYGDGSQFTSEDGLPWQAPRRNAQVILQKEDRTHGRDFLHGSGNNFNYFAWHPKRGAVDPWREGCWVPHSDMGKDQYLQEQSEHQVLLYGYWVDEEMFWSIYDRAFHHPDFKHLPIRVVPVVERVPERCPTETPSINT